MTYELRRGSQTLTLSITLGRYLDNPPLLIRIIVAQLLGLILWAAGVALCRFSLSQDVRARLLGLTGLFTGIIATNASVGWRSMLVYSVAQVTMCLAVVVGLAAHLYFPVPSLVARRRLILNGSTVVAFLLCAVLLFPMLAMLVVQDLSAGTLRVFSLLAEDVTYNCVGAFAFMAVMTSIGVLIYNRLRARDPDTRRQIGIVLWAAVLGLGPYAVLGIIEVVTRSVNQILLSYAVLPLALAPLAYVYVIYQRKLVSLDFTINQAIVYFAAVLLTFTISTAILTGIALGFATPFEPALAGGAVTALLSLFVPGLHQAVQRRVNRVLYGRHYDFLSVTSAFSERFAKTVDRETLAGLLTQGLAGQMGVQQNALFLADGEALVPQSPDLVSPTIAAGGDMHRALLDARKPLYAERLWMTLPPAEQERWAGLNWAQLFVPIVFEDRLQGLLVLGRRRLSDMYGEQDIQIIATVARQAALAYDNVRLISSLRQALAVVEKVQQRLLTAREEERRSLAWELHDKPMQDLIALSGQIAGCQDLADNRPALAEALEQARREAIRIMKTLRETCSGLRSDALDVIGLGPAMAEYAHGLMKKTGVAIYLDVPGHGPWLEDPLGITLLRVFQEASTNAVEHAQAQEVWVSFKLDGKAYELRVWDKGCGFALPARTELLALEGHLGLVTMHERVAAIGGKLNIRSAPGKGTEIRVWGEVERKPQTQ